MGVFIMGSSTPQSESFIFNPVLWKLHDVEVGGVLASRKANFYSGVLKDIWLIPDLWALHGLFKYATDDHPQTSPEKLSTLKIQEGIFFFFFFSKKIAL